MKNVSIDEIYTKYINGSSVEELSSEYNVSENFIYKGLRNYAKERNIDIKTERRKNKIDMALVYEMHKSGISCEEIGELFNCSYRTIFRRLHDYCDEFNLPFDRKSKEERLMEKISLVYEEYNEGATITELSKKYNCNINIISEALKKYSYQEGKELNIKTGGRKAIKLPEAYGCCYEVLRRNLKEYIGEENWQTYVRNKRGRGEKNREVTLDDIKIVYRRAFAEEIKQIITLKETKEEEKPKVKSLGRK